MRQQKIPDRLCKTSVDKYVKFFHETAEQQTKNKIVLAEKICEIARHICESEGETGSHHLFKMKELLNEWDLAKK